MKRITGLTALAWFTALRERRGLQTWGFSFRNTNGERVSVYLDGGSGPTVCWAKELLAIARYELGEGLQCSTRTH